MRKPLSPLPRRRRGLALAFAIAAGGVAAPALAACPIGWTGPCYSAHAETSNSLILGSYAEVTSYGAGPQTAQIPRNDQTGWASASSDSLNNGTLTVVAVTNTRGFHAVASADIQYSFQLQPTGATTVPLVPLHVYAAAASLRTSTYGPNENAIFDLEQAGQRLAYAQSYTPFGRETEMFTVDQWVQVDPTRPLTLFMYAKADAFADPSTGNDRFVSQVIVDPVFEIAPEFASLYQLVGLPSGDTGAPGEPTGVPEPAAWALMLSGFSLLGQRLRSRRKSHRPILVG